MILLTCLIILHSLISGGYARGRADDASMERTIAESSMYKAAVTIGNKKNAQLEAIESLVIKKNYPAAFSLPATASDPEIITYIREQSPLIFKDLLSTSQYTKAYKFSVAYRDVFSTVDVENATLIRTYARNWLTQIQTKATTEIEEIANTIAALTGRETLKENYRLKGIKLIKSFPEGDPIRIHLQGVYNAITRTPLPEIRGEEKMRLNVVRKMADQLFPDEG